MNALFRPAGLAAAAFAVLALTGCASSHDAKHARHHSASSSPHAMDMKAMCEMHQKMMSTKTPEERQAMMDQHMKSMSPEKMKAHMEMMQNKCK